MPEENPRIAAQATFGILVWNGEGVKQDIAAGSACFALAAAIGHNKGPASQTLTISCASNRLLAPMRQHQAPTEILREGRRLLT